jgi:hypothetical protein
MKTFWHKNILSRPKGKHKIKIFVLKYFCPGVRKHEFGKPVSLPLGPYPILPPIEKNQEIQIGSEV